MKFISHRCGGWNIEDKCSSKLHFWLHLLCVSLHDEDDNKLLQPHVKKPHELWAQGLNIYSLLTYQSFDYWILSQTGWVCSTGNLKLAPPLSRSQIVWAQDQFYLQASYRQSKETSAISRNMVQNRDKCWDQDLGCKDEDMAQKFTVHTIVAEDLVKFPASTWVSLQPL